MREESATILGLCAAASVPPIAGLAVSFFDGGIFPPGIAVVLILWPFSAFSVLVLGLPAFLFLRPYRPGHWWSVATVGFFLGVVVAFALRVPGAPSWDDAFELGCVAALSALAFWLIWKRAAPPPRRTP